MQHNLKSHKENGQKYNDPSSRVAELFEVCCQGPVYTEVSQGFQPPVCYEYGLRGHRGDYLLTSLMSRHFSMLAVYRTKEHRELMNNNRNCTFGRSIDL